MDITIYSTSTDKYVPCNVSCMLATPCSMYVTVHSTYQGYVNRGPCFGAYGLQFALRLAFCTYAWATAAPRMHEALIRR